MSGEERLLKSFSRHDIIYFYVYVARKWRILKDKKYLLLFCEM
jgi:hypothetical protein